MLFGTSRAQVLLAMLADLRRTGVRSALLTGYLLSSIEHFRGQREVWYDITQREIDPT